MLIEFRVENHRSLRDEQAITMETGRVGEISDPRPRNVAGHKEKLLPAAVVYGANASGKSNLLSAIAFMNEAVTQSHNYWEPYGRIPRIPFAWGNKKVEPSLFEATFLVEGIKYCYGFVLSDTTVEEEWLFAWPKGRKQIWYAREGGEYKFGERLKGPNEVIEEVTRSNALFLSTAAQHQHEQLGPIYQWFNMIETINILPETRVGHRGLIAETIYLDSSMDVNMDVNLERMRVLLGKADVGIVNIKQVEDDQNNNRQLEKRFLLQHEPENDNSWLLLEEESGGTKQLFKMAPLIFYSLDSGSLLLIDELETSLHPLLGQAIIKMFHCPKANPNNAQLLFTTHDTNLLGTTLGEPALRRDQIWFAEKDETGASKIYPLTDFKPRKSENLERGYLQGRYGAIPFLGDFSWVTE